MAQFDIHRLADGPGLVVDCQSDIHDHIATRFVIPLIPLAVAPAQSGHLTPVFRHNDESYLLLTQTAASVDRRHLGPVVGSLATEYLAIVRAIDVLIGGV